MVLNILIVYLSILEAPLVYLNLTHWVLKQTIYSEHRVLNKEQGAVCKYAVLPSLDALYIFYFIFLYILYFYI